MQWPATLLSGRPSAGPPGRWVVSLDQGPPRDLHPPLGQQLLHLGLVLPDIRSWWLLSVSTYFVRTDSRFCWVVWLDTLRGEKRLREQRSQSSPSPSLPSTCSLLSSIAQTTILFPHFTDKPKLQPAELLKKQNKKHFHPSKHRRSNSGWNALLKSTAESCQ